VNCVVPVRVRLVGRPTDEDLLRLEDAVARLVTRQLLAGQRALRESGPAGGGAQGQVRDRYDPAAEQAASSEYLVASYQQPGSGARARVPLTAPRTPGAEQAGSRVVTRAELVAKVSRIVNAPRGSVADGREAFAVSPERAMASLSGTHFRDDDDRLSYALGVFQAQLGARGGGAEGELFAMLLRYEEQVQSQTAHYVGDVPLITPESGQALGRALAQQAEDERRDYEIFMEELEAIRNSRMGFAGTVGVYEYYVGGPVKAGIEYLKEEGPGIASLLLDFLPVVGQLKVLTEAIIGRDLLTWRKLEDWERWLNALLVLIPEAKRIFAAGRTGLRTLAKAVDETRWPADRVYRATKEASKLSVNEVEAARKITAGAPPSEAQQQLARSLKNMEEPAAAEVAPHPGEPVRPPEPRAQAPAPQPRGLVTDPRFGPPREISLRGQPHQLTIGRIGTRWRCLLCSEGCGPIIDKASAMIAKLKKSDPAVRELRALIAEAKKADTWVNDALNVVEEGQVLNTAQQTLKLLEDTLKDIEARYPYAIIPDPPPAAAAPAPEEVTPPPTEAPVVPAVTPPPGEAGGFLQVGRERLSLRGLDAEIPLGKQLAEGEMKALTRSPRLRGVGAHELPGLSPRDLATRVAEGRMTPKMFDGIMKAAEDRIAERAGTIR
jgi:hypothetical protein